MPQNWVGPSPSDGAGPARGLHRCRWSCARVYCGSGSVAMRMCTVAPSRALRKSQNPFGSMGGRGCGGVGQTNHSASALCAPRSNGAAGCAHGGSAQGSGSSLKLNCKQRRVPVFRQASRNGRAHPYSALQAPRSSDGSVGVKKRITAVVSVRSIGRTRLPDHVR